MTNREPSPATAVVLLIVSLIASGIFFITTVGCKKKGGVRQDSGAYAPAHSPVDRRIELANDVVENIVYIRDPRSQLCFAYLYQTRGESKWATGGPALANVPCPHVEHLLVQPMAEAPDTLTPEQFRQKVKIAP